MKTIKYLSYIVLCTFVLSLASCEPSAIKEDKLFLQEEDLAQLLADENAAYGGEYKIYTINEFLKEFMTEEGNYLSDTTPYRTRTTRDNIFYLYTVDTIKTDTVGIYIRGRVSTDDYAGNFYKAMVIQQMVDGKQQNLRISVDMGSVGGLYQMGQEIIIRCNGLSVGRYANQPQLCVPSYNNNIYAINNTQKVGWCPGRIPSARFRKAVRLIGQPDPSKLHYDEYTLEQLFNVIPRKINYDGSTEAQKREFMEQVRLADGSLVRIKRVSFTGYTNNDGSIDKCIYFEPSPTYKSDSAALANVFAPTTNNIGYPQSRILCDALQQFTPGNTNQLSLCCSSSEYSKFANYFIPGAEPDFANAVAFCSYYSGTVTGILGWYCDNATHTKKGLAALSGMEWSVTPRGIPGIGVEDIVMKSEYGDVWKPKEFDPQEYFEKKNNQ